MLRFVLLLVLFGLSACTFVAPDGTKMYVVEENAIRTEFKMGVSAGCASGAMGAISMFADPREYGGMVVTNCVATANELGQQRYPEPTSIPTVNDELEDLGVEFQGT